ncbi:hypothetical protein PFISCL1PPCAC_7908, partial [Pristionchus fissidentatus]
INRQCFFELAACTGKTFRPPEIAKHWPEGRVNIDIEEAFQLFTELDEVKIRKNANITTEQLAHLLQRMDLPADDRFFMERHWISFTKGNGSFDFDGFVRGLANDREIYLDDQDELRDFYHN